MTVVAKMHGAGNDFVVVAEAPPPAPHDASLVRSLADRRRGIGADGVLFLERESTPDREVRMHFYNCDGGRAGLCLNGSRCVALRAVQLGWVEGRFEIRTDHRIVRAEVIGPATNRAEVRLELEPVEAASEHLLLPGQAPARTGYAVQTGDPHLVVEVSEELIESPDFESLARPLRWWKGPDPAGSNVHFVSRGDDEWRIRSFERGIEAETLACGSGCVSAVAALAPQRDREIALRVSSGDLIRVDPRGDVWTLRGPAVCVFTCEVDNGER